MKLVNEQQLVFHSHEQGNLSPIGLYYNAEFKENTKADLDLLDILYKKSMREFIVIKTSSDLMSIKILHYFHKKYKLKEHSLKTVDGVVLESFLEKFDNNITFDIFGFDHIINDVNGKWVVFFNIKEDWNYKEASKLCNRLVNNGAIGLIAPSTDNPLNFIKAVELSNNFNVTSFPE